MPALLERRSLREAADREGWSSWAHTLNKVGIVSIVETSQGAELHLFGSDGIKAVGSKHIQEKSACSFFLRVDGSLYGIDGTQ